MKWNTKSDLTGEWQELTVPTLETLTRRHLAAMFASVFAEIVPDVPIAYRDDVVFFEDEAFTLETLFEGALFEFLMLCRADLAVIAVLKIAESNKKNITDGAEPPGYMILLLSHVYQELYRAGELKDMFLTHEKWREMVTNVAEAADVVFNGFRDY